MQPWFFNNWTWKINNLPLSAPLSLWASPPPPPLPQPSISLVPREPPFPRFMARSSLTAEPLPQRATNWSVVTLYKLSAEPCSSADRWGMFSFTSLPLCGCLTHARTHTHTHIYTHIFLCTWAQHFKDERRGTAVGWRWEVEEGGKCDPSSHRSSFLSSWAASHPPLLNPVGCPWIEADFSTFTALYTTQPTLHDKRSCLSIFSHVYSYCCSFNRSTFVCHLTADAGGP